MLRCYAVTLSRSLLTHFLLYKASYKEEFLGSLAAEVPKGVIPGVLWLAESWIDCPVVFSVHVNSITFVNTRIVLSGLRLRKSLAESKMILAVMRDCTNKALALRHAPGLLCKKLQVNIQLRVRARCSR